MTRVKICGITDIGDARLAIECGAHALGFVMEPSSPRFVGSSADVEAILAELPPYVYTVAVFGPPPDFELPLGIHAVQCVGTMAARPTAAVKVVCALRPEPGPVLPEAVGPIPCNVDAILLDAFDPERFGGTGRTSNWDLAASLRDRWYPMPLVLAGGLTPENVGDAIRKVRPFAVDVGSGVEESPGKKDPVRLRRFMEAVRKVDEELGL